MINSIKIALINIALKLIRATCKDTGPLISEQMDHPLPFFSRWRLKLHLRICGVCQCYKEQLETLRVVAIQLREEESQVFESAELSVDAKNKIKQILENSN